MSDDHKRKLRDLEATIEAQDAEAEINDNAAALLRRIVLAYPDLDVEKHEPRWFELDDERLVLQLEGGEALFELHGEVLHVVGPIGLDLAGRDAETIPDADGNRFPLSILRGKVACIAILPDGRYYLAAMADDPFGAAAAALN